MVYFDTLCNQGQHMEASQITLVFAENLLIYGDLIIGHFIPTAFGDHGYKLCIKTYLHHQSHDYIFLKLATDKLISFPHTSQCNRFIDVRTLVYTILLKIRNQELCYK